jgi:hypothetical protein
MNKNHLSFPGIILVLFTLFQCTQPEKKTPLLELLSPDDTGIDFNNQLSENEDLNIITFEYFYNGAGVGIGDINNDGLKDIFFSANMSSNRLYLNKGDLKFEDITASAGLTTSGKWAAGVAMVDINQDSLLDIYVCYAGPFANPQQRANELYINNGNNTFTEKARQYGLADTGHSVQAAFFDYDRDGDLDVYLLTNITDETGPNVIRPKRVKGEMVNTDRLYRNNGDQTFTDVSKAAGITIEGYGLGVSIADITRDGWPDVYVSNDYLSNDLLYINNRDGTFTDRAGEYFKHTSYSAMGNDASDFSNDGLLDLVSVDMLPPDNKRQKLMFGAVNYDRYRSEIKSGYTPQFMRNTLQLNEGMDPSGKPLFSEIGQLAGIHATDWSWSPLFADLDNDGWKDLLVTNGYPRDITNRDFANYRMQEFMQKGYDQSIKKKFLEAVKSLEGAYIPGFAFRNNGDLTFTDQSSLWGFTTPAYSTGAAYADLDNDGDLEYVTNNINGPAFVFKSHANEYTASHFLRIRFSGPPGNMQGYGATVLLYGTGDTLQYQEHFPIRGYQSTSEQEIHFGLAHHTMVDSIRIGWPDGKQQVIRNIKADQLITVSYREAKDGVAEQIDPVKRQSTSPLFVQAEKNRGIEYVHSETEYVDFKIQPLLPHKCSEEGPGIAVGDVNGDGLEDFFIGGGFKQPGQFFLQTKRGKFQHKELASQLKYEEDLGVLLFDADGDKDNDLYVVSGGNEFQAGSPYYQDRLYINDGKGNFKHNPDALPVTTGSGSCVIAADYDGDDDLDLFVGGRLAPQHYPHAGASYILQNDGGRFSDVTEKVAPGLKDIGMVSAALWTDVDNDDKLDILVVGEWMPVTVFHNQGGTFQKSPMTVPNSAGWWNSVYAGDFDEDGDTDYVLGNLGTNSKYKTSAEGPLRLYLTDFNHDGTEDAVMAHYIQGVNRPAHPRDDMLHQMVSFKKKFPSYKSYAEVTMDGLITEMKVTPVVFEAATFQTSYLENRGKEGWVLKPLPVEAQFAPAYGITAGDYNGDGHLDIMLTGNSYAPDVLTGRYDALKGLVLTGDGAGNFRPLSVQQSGLLIDGNAKSLAELVTVNDQVLVLAAQNNDTLKIVETSQDTYRVIPVNADDVYAIITLATGKKLRQEFYYGAGYLSQSSRKLRVPQDAKDVILYNKHGKPRSVANR